LQHGQTVSLVDNCSRVGTQANLRWLAGRHRERLRVLICDVRDQGAMQKAATGVDVVLHLAAQVAVTRSLQSPLEDFDINLRGTLVLLEAIS
jgi:CDP-paratose 2-epimerase